MYASVFYLKYADFMKLLLPNFFCIVLSVFIFVASFCSALLLLRDAAFLLITSALVYAQWTQQNFLWMSFSLVTLKLWRALLQFSFAHFGTSMVLFNMQ